MGKLEIHHEYESGRDDVMGQRVGVLAAVLAVVLAIVTIASHRTHTAAIMHRTTANDAWSYYQAARIKFYVLDVGGNLLAVGSAQGAAADGMRADYEKQKKLFQAEAEQVQSDARKQDALAEIAEARAVRYDVGEGLLEIGLVLTSLYFIARRKMFPAMGVIAGISGSAIAITALMI
ncbi:MAG: DUF4337 family protein [Bryobacteraceae bacterium]